MVDGSPPELGFGEGMCSRDCMEQLWGLFAPLILLLLHLVISWPSCLLGHMGPRFTPSFIAACYIRVRWGETGHSRQHSEAVYPATLALWL